MTVTMCRRNVITFGLEYRCVLVLGLRAAINESNRSGRSVRGCNRANRHLVLGGTGAETRDWTDVRDVVRSLAMIGELPQQETCRVINGGSRRSTSVGEIATVLVKNWKRDVDVRYSGAVRAGDPFSLFRWRWLTSNYRSPGRSRSRGYCGLCEKL